MTDEQLRAMARRVLGLLGEYRQRRHPLSDTKETVYATGQTWHNADEIESLAVEIMREEMAKAQAESYAEAERLFPFVPHTDDDPTKSFVATTNGIEEQ